MIQILLVHNRFHFMQPITWLSYFIRMFTCSKWNHLAIRVQSETEDIVIESIGIGVIETNYETWRNHADRIVLPLTPTKQVDATEIRKLKGQPYGFRDLFQIARYIKATRWDGKPEWNGKNFLGFLCTEIGCLLMGINKFLVPGDWEFMPDLIKGKEFTTTKTKQTT